MTMNTKTTTQEVLTILKNIDPLQPLTMEQEMAIRQYARQTVQNNVGVNPATYANRKSKKVENRGTAEAIMLSNEDKVSHLKHKHSAILVRGRLRAKLAAKTGTIPQMPWEKNE